MDFVHNLTLARARALVVDSRIMEIGDPVRTLIVEPLELPEPVRPLVEQPAEQPVEWPETIEEPA